MPIQGNLDQRGSLLRIAALAPWVMHLAPPPSTGSSDPRSLRLMAELARKGVARRLVYASTSGVYGDAQGQRFDETRSVAPTTDRARRRVDAEAQVRQWAPRIGCRASLLRIPGIYASNREGGHPRERLARGTPILRAEDDVYTNHIHADDLARACLLALMRGKPQRIIHASDDSELRMGDYFDLAADLCGLPRPPRISRTEAKQVLNPMQMSFMSESRRLDNQRLKRELRLNLRYPTVIKGLKEG